MKLCDFKRFFIDKKDSLRVLSPLYLSRVLDDPIVDFYHSGLIA